MGVNVRLLMCFPGVFEREQSGNAMEAQNDHGRGLWGCCPNEEAEYGSNS